MAAVAPILDWLFAHEQARFDDLFLRFLPGGSLDNPVELTFGDLARQSRLVASHLSTVTTPGDRVLLLHPPGVEFSSAFMGTLLARCIAVPAYTPDPNRIQRTLARLQAIIQDSGARHVITTRWVADQAKHLMKLAPDLAALQWIVFDDLSADVGPWKQPLPSLDDVAYLQYTSGSTSRPRGVVLTHANVLHNMGEHLRFHNRTSAIETVSWVPLHHDMGLTLSLLGPLRQGVGSTLLSPLDFVRRPTCWLEALSAFKANTTGAPTFGYALAARKVTDEEVARLDLSAVRSLIVAAEHVDPGAMAAFTQRLAPTGLRPDTFSPAYGMAELVVLATGSPDGPRAARFDEESLRQGLVVPADDGVLLASSGRTSDAKLRIVREGVAVESEDQLGEIWLASGSVGKGYWQNDEATRATFGHTLEGEPDAFLKTGDLGFLHEGYLYVTGRQKDLIILAGDNLHPHDVEAVVEHAHPACRPGNSAAFAWRTGATEGLGVAVEVDLRKVADPTEVERAIRAAVGEQNNASITYLAFLGKGTLPKTSSGKRQRQKTAADLRSGDLATTALFDTAHTLATLLDRFTRPGEGDFFERGGQSIDLVRLGDAIEAKFGVDVPLHVLLADPTAAGIARAIAQATARVEPPANRTSGPATSSQARMTFLCQLGGPAYHVVHTQQIEGPLDVDRLQRAVASVVDLHPGLRTAWAWRNGACEQSERTTEADWVHLDLRDAPESVDDHFNAWAIRPFALDRGAPTRVFLARLDTSTYKMGWVWPHVAIDGFSVDLVDRDLWRAYEGLPLHHPTTSLLQASQPSSNGTLHYWERHLSGIASTQILGDLVEPAEPTWAGQTLHLPLDDRFAELLTLGRQESCTTYLTFLAWITVALHRWTDTSTVLIGSPVSARGPQLDVVGCFLETLLVRSDLTPTDSLRTHLRSVRTTVLEGLAHPIDLATLATHLDRRDPTRIVINHVLQTQQRPETELQITDVLTALPHSSADLTFELHERETLTLAITYATDRYTADMVARLVTHLNILLDGMIGTPDACLVQLPLLSDHETSMLSEWSTGATLQRTAQLLHEPVLQHPTTLPAVVQGDTTYTYGQLVARAKSIAHELVAVGHQPGQSVAVDWPRGFEQIASQVAISMCGGCIVPLAPDLPPKRRAFFLEDSDTRWILGPHDLLVPPTAQPFDPLDVAPESPAFLLYTSGSTGRPKGVRVTHQGLGNRLAGLFQLVPPASDDRFAQKTSPIFADALTEVFMPLWAGCPLIVVSDEVRAEPSTFLKLLATERVSWLLAVPSLLQILLGTHQLDGLEDLRVCISSGEAIPPALAEGLLDARPETQFFNLYGSSETSVDITAIQLGPDTLSSTGFPLPNVRLRIADRKGHLRPIGMSGELWVAGDAITPGYHNRPELVTRFTEHEGTRWFKTGDQMRWTPRGLRFDGRNDQQLKVRGARVDGTEVEHHLATLPGVREAAVELHNDSLVAYLVGGDPRVRIVRTALETTLPSHALPTRVVQLHSLPRLPSGKVDRTALPTPSRLPSAPSDTPISPLEHAIAEIWERVLQVDRVGRHDDFFDLGGQSLLAMQVLTDLEATVGHSLPGELVLKSNTVAQLARLLETPTTNFPHVSTLQPVGEFPPLFVVHGVEGSTARLNALASHLAGRRRVLGLQSSALGGQSTPTATIEGLASEYVDRICVLQPEGPILVGGYSFGGVVAFELAHQLERRGRTVAAVLLLDSRAPGVGGRRQRLRQSIAYTRMRAAVRVTRLRDRMTGKAVRRLDPVRAVKDAAFAAWARYRPTPWAGPVVWFRTEEESAIPTVSWHMVASSVEVVTIPGTHETCIREPLVAGLADNLADVMDRYVALSTHIPVG